jgi:FkbM family methyltransferase
MIPGIRWRRLEKIFIAGALLSGVINIGLVFYITHNRFHGTGSPLSGGLPDEGPTVILKKENLDNEFFIEVYRENDIVSGALQGFGWEAEHISELNGYFQDYSKEHNVPMSDLTFIDIGANIGWYTLSMAALGVKVLAFEPMEDNLKILKHSLSLSSNVKSGLSDRVTLYEHGLGAKDETCFLYSDNGNFGDGHVRCVEKESDLNMQENYSVRGRVPVKRLDDVVNAEGMHIVAVKMDTEGYEGNVLEGGSKLLLGGGVDAILTEFVPKNVVEKGGDPVEFMKKMTNAGFLAKRNTWGYDYFNNEEMVTMTNFGTEMVMLHSAAQRNKTMIAQKAWDREEDEMEKEMAKYGGEFGFENEGFDMYYENNSTTPTVKTANGDKQFAIEIYRNNDIVSNAIKNSYVGWELDTVHTLNDIFQEYSKKHDIPLANLTFVDIGANIGWLSLNMAALGAKVIAFEPMQENIKLLKSTLKKKMNVENGISDRITLYEHGLGAKEETCFLYSDDTNIGDGHVKCVEKESDLKMQANYTLRERVPLKRLDDVINVNAEGMHIVAVKMDTEGYEGNVLEGGTKLLLGGGVDAILTEFEPNWVTEKGGDPVEFMKKMTNAGYRIKRKEWGYMKKKDMMNMTNFGLSSGDLTFHSPTLVAEFTGQ